MLWSIFSSIYDPWKLRYLLSILSSFSFLPFFQSRHIFLYSQLVKNHNSIRIKLIILKMKIFKMFFLFSFLLLSFIFDSLLHFKFFFLSPWSRFSFDCFVSTDLVNGGATYIEDARQTSALFYNCQVRNIHQEIVAVSTYWCTYMWQMRKRWDVGMCV